MSRSCSHLAAIAILALSSFAVASADTIQLTNGDTVSGKVVSLDAQSLTLKSDALGDVKIARDKIAAILLGDRPAPPVSLPGVAKPSEPKAGLMPPTNNPLAADASVNDILKQIQSGGVDKSLTKSIEAEMPLLSNPEVQAYFQKTLGGLMTGDLSLSDLRKQAIDVRDQVKELEKDLGPEATQALSGYMGILENFIRQTEPKKAGEAKK